MEQVKMMSHDLAGSEGLAIIRPDDSVWVVIHLRWWNIVALIRWVLAPSGSTSTVQLKSANGTIARVSAIRVATRHVRVGTPPKKA